MTEDRAGFTAGDFFMIRTPLLPADTLAKLLDADAGPGGADPAALERRRAAVRKRLWDLASDPRFRQALHVASPSLAEQLSAAGDRPPTGRRADRWCSSLLRYAARMSSRPTPLGLFAGVGMGSYADRTTAMLDADPLRRTATRADAAWLDALFQRIEADPGLRDALRVRPNALLQRRADRILMDAESAPGHVSVRRTPPVERALALAEDGIAYGRLVARLAEAYPGTPHERIAALVERLWDLRLLRADLWALMDGGPVEARTAQALGGAGPVPGLEGIGERFAAVDAARGAAPLPLLEEAAAHQRRATPGFAGTVYQTDAALALADGAVSAEVAATAAEAARLTMRLKTTLSRPTGMLAYHRAFLERYGAGSEVPLLEVLSEQTGLGPPGDYRYPPRTTPLPPVGEPGPTDRDQALVDLVADAMQRSAVEVELTDALVERLAQRPYGDDDLADFPSMDVYAKIAAESRAALDEGRWRLVLSQGVFQGGQSFGRFADLLGPGTASRLRAFARAEEALYPDTVFAELNSAPWIARHGNLLVRPPVREYEVVVNASPALEPDRRLPLSDLLVGCTARGFYLRSARLGRRVVVTKAHAVTPTQAPNVCRALIDLSVDGFVQPSGFYWGPVMEAPFRPRLVRGRIVLSPAQWTVVPETFGEQGPPGDRDAFHALVQDWRAVWRVPRHVQLTFADNRLPLDLEHPSCTDELLKELKRTGLPGWPDTLRLEETLPGPSELWMEDREGRRYHSELVIPLRATAGAPQRGLPAAFAPRAEGAKRRWLPGERWTYLRLYASETQQQDLLTGAVGEFVARARREGLVDEWFFLRYVDAQPHLRLRLRAADEHRSGELLATAAAWAGGLVTAGRALDVAFASYDREVERYGGPEAIDAVEAAFGAGSELTLDLLRLTAAEPAFEPDLAAVVAMHALCTAWGADPAGYGFAPTSAARERFRPLRPLLCELLAPGEIRPDPAAAALRALLAPIVERRREAVAAAAATVRRLDAAGRLHGEPDRILRSLLHMQANRLLGISRDREHMAGGLWSLALRAIANRPPHSPGGAGRPSAGRV